MRTKQLSVVPFFEDLDDWEVITLVPQLIETLAYFQLVRCKSSDIIRQPYAYG